jgi:hypothetical protein
MVNLLQINISITGKGEPKVIEVGEDATPLEILNNLEFFPDEVIIISKLHSNKPIPINSKLKPGDLLTIIPVASGG